MCTFKDFLRWYNIKGVVPAPEVMHDIVDLYHNEEIDMLKLGCSLSNLAIICSHKSTTAKFGPSTESDKDILEKIRKNWLADQPLYF